MYLQLGTNMRQRDPDIEQADFVQASPYLPVHNHPDLQLPAQGHCSLITGQEERTLMSVEVISILLPENVFLCAHQAQPVMPTSIAQYAMHISAG